VALTGEVPQALLLALLTVLGIVIYLGLIAWLARDVVAEIRTTWSQRGG
jgi:hypothetical protein